MSRSFQSVQGDDEYGGDLACCVPEAVHLPSGRTKHHCTDVVGLVLLLIGMCGALYTQVHVYRYGNVLKVSRGFDYRQRVCGLDVPNHFLYWCRDPRGQLELNYPICVASCPRDDSGREECFDPTVNVTFEVPSYRTYKLGPICLPFSVRESRALLQQSVGRTRLGMILRAATTIEGSWPLLVEGGCLGVGLAYAYVRILQSYATPLLRVSMFFLVVAPLWLGITYLQEALTAASSGVAHSDLWFGLGLLAVSAVAFLVSCCFRSLETALGSIEAASELFISEFSIIGAPFISIVSKIAVLAYMAAGLALIFSSAEVKSFDPPYGILRQLDITPHLRLIIGIHLFMSCWMLELSSEISEYAIAWVTQKWYFTPLASDQKRRASAAGLWRGYAHALRYHLGSVALGSLIIMLTRPLRIVLGAFAQAAQDCSNCFGACASSVCALLIAVYQEYIQCWERCAYMDVAINSESFCSAAQHATEIIFNEVPTVASLRGAHMIFLVSGVAITGFAPAFAVWLQCKAARVMQLDQTYNPQFPKWILLSVAVICLSIGVSFVSIFDTVADMVLYCFALDQRWHKQKRRSQKAKSQPARRNGEDGTVFQWLWDSPDTDDDSVDDTEVKYAPRRLSSLIDKQEKLAHLTH